MTLKNIYYQPEHMWEGTKAIKELLKRTDFNKNEINE